MKVFLSNVVHDRLHEACASIDLPHPGALKLLLQLDADDPQPMRSLATTIGCDPSYVTALVDVLEAPGYVARQPAPGDRRVKLVCITPQGEAARARATDVMSEPPEAFRKLDAADARTLARLLAEAAEDLPAD
jgi:DNA-binding MarR family transcriptional regulator